MDFLASLLAAPATLAALLLLATALTAALALYALKYRQGLRLRDRLAAANTEIGQLQARDALTGLLTRTEFELALELAVQRSDEKQTPLAVLCIGLDGFRGVNDSLGHEAGDQVLRVMADRLDVACGQRALARIAGDEFVLLCDGDLDPARHLAVQLLALLARPMTLGSQELALTGSIGIASYPCHGPGAQLFPAACLAMATAKAAGGGAFATFAPAMAVDHRDQMALRNDLRLAVQARQLELVYQPKLDAASLQITGAEALLRWNHPTRGVVSPTVFIPVAERHGLIPSIGNWVIEEACRQAAQWRENGLRMRVAVNLSAYQVRQDDLVDRIDAALARHRIAPSRFTCEITESVAMEDTQVTQRTFERLRQSGVHVSIDDFGTGYSSLASLRRLPAEELKIDRAFVSDLHSSADARAIAMAIVQMAHSLGLRVVAEGVETETQRDLLRSMGCDELQGYLFAKPMSALALAMWASDDRPERERAFRDSLFQETTAAALDKY